MRQFLTLSLILLILASCVSPSSNQEKAPLDLRAINFKINNHIQYVNDVEGKDYWQSPKETARLGTGDCEDFAILKAELLPEYYTWRLLLVFMEDKNVQHIILLVDEKWVLDNNSIVVYNYSELPYKLIGELPLYSTKRPIGFTKEGKMVYKYEQNVVYFRYSFCK